MSTIVRAPRTTRPSRLAAALALAAFGIYIGWSTPDTDGIASLPLALLLAGSLVLPPWGLCQLVDIGVRRGGPTLAKLGWVLDAAAWLVGTVVSALAFSLAYDIGFPDPWVVVLFLAYSVPAFVFAALVRALAGAKRYGHVARLIAAAAVTIAVLTLALRVITILVG